MNKAFDLWCDEENEIAYLRTYRTLTAKDVDMLMELAENKFEGKEINYSLIDMSETKSESIAKEAREAFRKYADSINYKKVAIVGATPSTRMLAKIALAIVGKSDITRFFKTEAEALAWLKGGRK